MSHDLVIVYTHLYKWYQNSLIPIFWSIDTKNFANLTSSFEWSMRYLRLVLCFFYSIWSFCEINIDIKIYINYWLKNECDECTVTWIRDALFIGSAWSFYVHLVLFRTLAWTIKQFRQPPFLLPSATTFARRLLCQQRPGGFYFYCQYWLYKIKFHLLRNRRKIHINYDSFYTSSSY